MRVYSPQVAACLSMRSEWNEQPQMGQSVYSVE